MTELPIILDNLIDEETQNQIEDAMFDIKWKFVMDNTSPYNPKLMGMKYRKFLSPFEYNISPSIQADLKNNLKGLKLINPVLQKTFNYINFDVKKIRRCMAGIQGVQVIREKNIICEPHINCENPHLVLLYYVNNSDGETILYDKFIDNFLEEEIFDPDLIEKYQFNIVKKIMPKQGRILLFDGRNYHSASSPTTGVRCIITLDIFGEFKDGSYKFPLPEDNDKRQFKYN